MFKRYIVLLFLLVPVLAGAQGVSSSVAKNVEDSCRPWVRWWWNGDKVDTVELKRELRLLKEAGIGGVEINPIEFPGKRCDSLGLPSLTWLSEEWLDALEVALREAKSLGLGCDLLVGSGWPFGMETLPMEERAQVMLTYVTEVDWSDSTGGTFVITKQQIFDAVDPKVTVPNEEREFELVDLFVVPDTIHHIGERNDLYLPEGDTIEIPSIVQITNIWHPSASGKYLLYALVWCRSFASVINGAPGASGPILDHMNQQAVRRYLDHMRQVLEGRLGPMSKWLRAYFVDSMELEGCNWTTDFAEEFKRRRGYDLMPWLPFTMFKVGRLGDVLSYEYGAQQSPEFKKKVQQVRHDFELTKAELLQERYTETFLNWCKEQGVKSRAQAYGRGFFPLESSLGYDIPEGESWTTNYLRHRVGEEMPESDYRRGRAYTMINKYVSSAAHQSGRRMVSAEEMTNTYRMFETTLELLKLGSDMSAISGTTHSVWHGFNYNPPEAGFPGWVQYGSYYNEKNSWWPYFHLLNEYRARMSAILQRADMQTDIAILVPDEELWAEYGVQTEPFPNYPKGSRYEVPQLLWEAVHKHGGNCDFVTARQLREADFTHGQLKVGQKSYWALLVITEDTVWEPAVPEGFADLPVKVVAVPNLRERNYMEWYGEAQRRLGLPHAVTIVEPNRFLLQNHYRNDEGEDIFLFVNAWLHGAVASTIAFPAELLVGRTAWAYDCNTGEKQRLELETDYKTDERLFWLYLPPAESLVILLEKSDAKDMTAPAWAPAYNEGQEYFTIPMEWHLSLHHAIEGWTRDTTLTQLCDLRETGFKDFSGTATYMTHFHLDSVNTIEGVQFTPESLDCLDFGEVYDICELRVNGVDCGTKWYGERIYTNLGGLLHAGENTIEIRVTTTLNNYVHTLTEDKVVQHFVIKRNVPTTKAGLVGIEGGLGFF